MVKDSVRTGFDMLFSKLYKNMVNKVTFFGFKEGDCPNRPSLGIAPVFSRDIRKGGLSGLKGGVCIRAFKIKLAGVTLFLRH